MEKEKERMGPQLTDHPNDNDADADDDGNDNEKDDDDDDGDDDADDDDGANDDKTKLTTTTTNTGERNPGARESGWTGSQPTDPQNGRSTALLSLICFICISYGSLSRKQTQQREEVGVALRGAKGYYNATGERHVLRPTRTPTAPLSGSVGLVLAVGRPNTLWLTFREAGEYNGVEDKTVVFVRD